MARRLKHPDDPFAAELLSENPGFRADLLAVTLQMPVYAAAMHASAAQPLAGIVEKGTSGPDLFEGTAGDDIYSGGSGDDNLIGGPGDDRLIGGAGNDLLRGGEFGDLTGNDRLSGGSGTDTLGGDQGNDLLCGGPGPDFLVGGDGIDTADYRDAVPDPGPADAFALRILLSLNGSQFSGSDAAGERLVQIENLNGSDYRDFFAGDDNANRLHGYAGDDVLNGLAGGDALYGDAGHDLIYGGADARVDLLIGGPGADVFKAVIWEPFEEDPGVTVYFQKTIGQDVIADFVTGEDMIEIDTIESDAGTASFENLQIVDGTNSRGDSGASILLPGAGSFFVIGVAAAEVAETDFSFVYL